MFLSVRRNRFYFNLFPHKMTMSYIIYAVINRNPIREAGDLYRGIYIPYILFYQILMRIGVLGSVAFDLLCRILVTYVHRIPVQKFRVICK